MSDRRQGTVRNIRILAGFIKGDEIYSFTLSSAENMSAMVAYTVVPSKKYEGRLSAHDVELLQTSRESNGQKKSYKNFFRPSRTCYASPKICRSLPLWQSTLPPSGHLA